MKRHIQSLYVALIAGVSLLFGVSADARYLQPDPGGYAGGNNLYAYVGNDPLNNTDPTGLQQIPPDAMAHILNAHGVDTLRTRPNNSVFSPEYSNPAALQQLSNQVFSSPLAPPAPFYGGLMILQGQVVLQNPSTSQTLPYPIGVDANGNPTNQVQIRFDPTNGNVSTMFPVPIAGNQPPQSSITPNGLPIVPVSFTGATNVAPPPSVVPPPSNVGSGITDNSGGATSPANSGPSMK